MGLNEFKEAIGLLFRMPLLWIAGLAGGAFAVIIWLTTFSSGAFFASRLIVIFSLVLLFLTTGMLAAIRKNDGSLRAQFDGGLQYYFRVLLPQIVIGFILMLVMFLCSIIFALIGLGSDIGLIMSLTFGFMLPTLMLTFFFDTAAVFEDSRVFDSIKRSMLVVSEHMLETLGFFIISALYCMGVIFGLMIIWEAVLFDKLKPLMDFTEEQKQAFTPEQLIAMIGPDGIWITAVVLFIGVLVILPVLVSYKACFYRKISGDAQAGPMTTGEYDSKGRWYKY
ncbi:MULTISPECIES: hypothetical protein [unclassified Methanoregula]|uniref:DUF7847 domain-containing protein n=1 Tax=unclassified Methanoregula TaxID=2649730 RepID=UPI0009C66BBA|nr:MULTISPECIES: hypothetical protein [unclassified Methanoregula]OPX63669.1 MAG: hypothetical protein A4E33_01605 [Methanoregula sp. PtaB.Bin085]OPY36164.1 MAG: hypothetical protein A4E34_00341 [Methanoregula sp. PtaU1.Bin006]